METTLLTSNTSKQDHPPPYSPPTAPTAPPPYTSTPENTYWQRPPGYYPSTGVHQNPGNFVPSYGATQSTTIIDINYNTRYQSLPTTPDIILVGACPACRIGALEDGYSCLGLLCAILFFPFGIICCQLLKTRRCSNCGAYFG